MFLLALLMPAIAAVHAETNESSSTSAPVMSGPGDGQAQTTAPAQADNPQMTVQERIRLRRQQREAQAIHDTYSQEWEGYLGMGYLRFIPGPNKERVAYYAWDTAVTRYLSERLGITGDMRGYYGTAYVGLNFAALTRPAISEYTMTVGPTYRVYVRPKYSIAVRALGGAALGNFSSDTNGFGSVQLGLYPDGWTYAISPSLIGEANLSPNLSLRLSGDDLLTGFGSSNQNSFGFNAGFVYRFGKKLP